MDHMMLYLNLVEHDEVFKLEPKSSVICDAYWEKAKDILLRKREFHSMLMLLAPAKRYMLECVNMESDVYKQAIEEMISLSIKDRQVHSVVFASPCMSQAMKNGKLYRQGDSLLVWAQHLGQEPRARIAFIEKGPEKGVVRLVEDSNIIQDDKPFGFIFKSMPVYGKYDEDSLYRGKDKK